MYLTYEGLKLKVNPKKNVYIHEFVSYLWGIETYSASNNQGYEGTCLYLTYEGLKHRCNADTCQPIRVCILPMRDWNVDISSGYFCKIRVCILPMRDWNIFDDISDPNNLLQFVSYLWGIETPAIIFPSKERDIGLYLTYEGLKPANGKIISWSEGFVCILPMRDWNSKKAGKK